METRPINATLYVDAFTPTGNPGEYTFENAIFNNQADQTGNGAFDVQADYVIYVPSTSFNTGMQLPGVVHRYKLTSVTPIDAQTVSGTMVWDEIGQEGLEIPTNGSTSGLSAPSPNKKFGYAPPEGIYDGLPPGFATQSVQTDLWNIVDPDQGGGGGPSQTYKTTIGDATEQSFNIHHSFGTYDITVTVYDLSTGEDVYTGVTRTGPDDVRIDFSYPIDVNSHRVIVRA